MPKRYEYDCAQCGRHFSTEFYGFTLCPKCREKLPHCESCHRPMGSRYGYMVNRARTVDGFGDICTSCDYEIKNKGFLHLNPIHSGEQDRFLLPDGTIVDKMPERTN